MNRTFINGILLKAFCLSLLVIPLMTPPPAGAQLVGTDTAPGAPCTAKGAARITANPEGAGAYVLTCNDNNGEWIATFNVESPTTPAQAANKDYVDTAIAAAGLTACSNDTADQCLLERTRSANDPEFIPDNIANGVNILGVVGTFVAPPSYPGAYPYVGPESCPEIGDLCTNDGTIFAGIHPTLHVPLYIPPTNQGSDMMKWQDPRTLISTSSIDDGKSNTEIAPNVSSLPAFKVCKDLIFGGHDDWYLPSIVEMYYIWSNQSAIESKNNITNFHNESYWTSTENNPMQSWVQLFGANGAQANNSNKISVRYVRCMRR